MRWRCSSLSRSSPFRLLSRSSPEMMLTDRRHGVQDQHPVEQVLLLLGGQVQRRFHRKAQHRVDGCHQRGPGQDQPGSGEHVGEHRHREVVRHEVGAVETAGNGGAEGDHHQVENTQSQQPGRLDRPPAAYEPLNIPVGRQEPQAVEGVEYV